MGKASVAAKRAAMAMTVAAGLIAGAGIALRLVDPAPSARAAIAHVMPGHDAEPLAARPAAAEANAVVINDFKYGPATLTVAAGTRVVWTNDDPDPHTVVSEADPKLFKSPPLDTGDSFDFTFDKPGTYRYFCTIHPRMQGTIFVQ